MMKKDTFWADLERMIAQAHTRYRVMLEQQQRADKALGGLKNFGGRPARKRKSRPTSKSSSVHRVLGKYRKTEAKPVPKKRFSAAARAKLSRLAKARWRKAKKAGKTRLG